MTIRKIFLTSCVITTIAAGSAMARVDVDIDIGVAPPVAPIEVVPDPRPGYVWAPGYYEWESERHVWHKGHWIEEHPGHRWVADRWDQHGNKWHHERGHWDKDY